MGRILVVATAGAGGDLQPLAAGASALRDRKHDVIVLGDDSVRRSLVGIGIETEALPPELDLGPALAGAIRDAMAATDENASAAGPIVQARMATWASEVAPFVVGAIDVHRPDVVVTSLFGVEVLNEADPRCPWAVVNSTFYVGPDPARPVEVDFAPRAVPLISKYASLLGSADLVLHASDPVFDLSHGGLPNRHHYVGPLGIWEPPSERPSYLDEPGDPWILVSISTQMQDDLPLAEAALRVLADRPARVVLTVGPDHAPTEVAMVPSNARVEQMISHGAVLERAALLLSHAGHGSVMKALWYGCPMVLVPWGRDQPGVAARAARLGVAEVVAREDASIQRLSEAVDRVLRDERPRTEGAKHAARLRASDPPAVTAALIEDLI